jgi:alkylation response protein AidB-like acyl-CoA dehydrogenase
MPIELAAHTEPGAHLVTLAERLSEEIAARAAEHDRDGSYPFEAIEALKAAGYFAAPVPVELGGLGVSSAHDLVVGSSRLARGDASVAIGVNMHLVAVLNMERRLQVAVAAGQERRARGFAESLERISRDGVVLAAAISEPGQDLTRPGTRATRTESGWRIDGRKLFCTMSPAATDLYVAVSYADARARRARARRPRKNQPGDRRTALHGREDRQRARIAHPHQARRTLTDAGRHRRTAPRTRQVRAKNARPADVRPGATGWDP